MFNSFKYSFICDSFNGYPTLTLYGLLFDIRYTGYSLAPISESLLTFSLNNDLSFRSTILIPYLLFLSFLKVRDSIYLETNSCFSSLVFKSHSLRKIYYHI